MTEVTQLQWATARVREWAHWMGSMQDLFNVPVGVQFVAADQRGLNLTPF